MPSADEASDRERREPLPLSNAQVSMSDRIPDNFRRTDIIFRSTCRKSGRSRNYTERPQAILHQFC